MKEYYDKPAVSNSAMKFINPDQGGSPALYKKMIIDGEKGEDTPSLENGKLIHLYVEKPEEFLISDVERPTAMLATWVEEVYDGFAFESVSDVSEDNDLLRTVALEKRGERYKSTKKEDTLWAKFCEGLDYLKHLIEEKDKICMTSAQAEVVQNCINSLRSHKVASKMLFETGENFGDEAFNELAIYWKIFDGELDCKALLDRVRVFPAEKRVELIDLKTTSKSGNNFKSSFKYYRYYRQLGWYMLALQKWMEEKYDDVEKWTFDAYIVTVETTGLYQTHVHSIGLDWLQEGMLEANYLAKRVYNCIKENNWELSEEEKANNSMLKLTMIDDDRRSLQRWKDEVVASGFSLTSSDD